MTKKQWKLFFAFWGVVLAIALIFALTQAGNLLGSSDEDEIKINDMQDLSFRSMVHIGLFYGDRAEYTEVTKEDYAHDYETGYELIEVPKKLTDLEIKSHTLKFIKGAPEKVYYEIVAYGDGAATVDVMYYNGSQPFDDVLSGGDAVASRVDDVICYISKSEGDEVIYVVDVPSHDGRYISIRTTGLTEEDVITILKTIL